MDLERSKQTFVLFIYDGAGFHGRGRDFSIISTFKLLISISCLLNLFRVGSYIEETRIAYIYEINLVTGKYFSTGIFPD